MQTESDTSSAKPAASDEGSSSVGQENGASNNNTASTVDDEEKLRIVEDELAKVKSKIEFRNLQRSALLAQFNKWLPLFLGILGKRDF
jgi:hypothetical protein